MIGDALYVRAVLPVREIAGTGVLGPARRLAERPRASDARRQLPRHPARAQRVRRCARSSCATSRSPTGAIPRLVRQISRGNRPDGLAPNALAVTTPRSLADVRIANGHVTLYKTTGAATP